MAKVRVSTLAKEFGMTSKELMGHLADMKIPAKSASSTLEDAYDLEIPYLKFRRCETLGAAAEYVASLEEE